MYIFIDKYIYIHIYIYIYIFIDKYIYNIMYIHIITHTPYKKSIFYKHMDPVKTKFTLISRNIF